MSEKHTVFDSNNFNVVVGRGLSTKRAAILLLEADGFRWRISREGGTRYFRLYTSIASRNSAGGAEKMTKTKFVGFSHFEIFTQVVDYDWRGYEALTDAQYDEKKGEYDAQQDDC